MQVTFNTATEVFNAYARIDADRDACLRAFLVMATDAPTFEVWEKFRAEFGAAMRARKATTDDAVNTAWSRFVGAAQLYAAQNDYDLILPKKPASTSKAATEKAAQRAKPEAVEKAATVAELAAIPMPSDKLEAAKLEAAIAQKKAALIKAEAKGEEKARAEALKGRADALIAYIRECAKAGRADLLAELEGMRDHNAPVVIAALPLESVQAAMPKLMQLVASAPAKAQKPRKAKASA